MKIHLQAREQMEMQKELGKMNILFPGMLTSRCFFSRKNLDNILDTILPLYRTIREILLRFTWRILRVYSAL